MAQFDELVSKYRNLTYGRLAGTNPSAVNSLLNAQDRGSNVTNSSGAMVSPNYFGNIPTEQQQYIETPDGLIGQNRFRIDPNTGIPVFETPSNESIGSNTGSSSYDSSIDYGDPGSAGVLPVDPETGLISTTATEAQRLGGGGRDARDQGMDIDNYNFAGNRFVGENLNEDGSIPYGDLLNYTPAGILSKGLTSSASQLNNLQGLIDQNSARTAKGLGTGAANQIAGIAMGIRQGAEKSGDVNTATEAAKLQTGYSGLSRDYADDAMTAAKKAAEENKDKFNLSDIVSGAKDFFSDKKKDKGKDKEKSTGGMKQGYGSTDADKNRESQRGNY